SLCGNDSDNSPSIAANVISPGNPADVNIKQELSPLQPPQQDGSGAATAQVQHLSKNLIKINDHQVPVLSPKGSTGIYTTNPTNHNELCCDGCCRNTNIPRFSVTDQTDALSTLINKQDSGMRSSQKFRHLPLKKTFVNQHNGDYSMKMIDDDIPTMSIASPVTIPSYYNKDMTTAQKMYAAQQHVSENVQTRQHHHYHPPPPPPSQQQHYRYPTTRLSSPNSQQQQNEQHLLMLSLANNNQSTTGSHHQSQSNTYYNQASSREEEEQQLLSSLNDPYKRDFVLKLLREMNQSSPTHYHQQQHHHQQQQQQNDQFQSQLIQTTAQHRYSSLPTAPIDNHNPHYRPTSQQLEHTTETQYSYGMPSQDQYSQILKSTKPTTRNSRNTSVYASHDYAQAHLTHSPVGDQTDIQYIYTNSSSNSPNKMDGSNL
ncbi:unnamed protein product, partial [Didymodactylos carnosus]